MARRAGQHTWEATGRKKYSGKTTHIKQKHEAATGNDFVIGEEKGADTERSVPETPVGKWQPEAKFAVHYGEEPTWPRTNVRYDRKNCTEPGIPPLPSLYGEAIR